jgi:hypothetical protein
MTQSERKTERARTGSPAGGVAIVAGLWLLFYAIVVAGGALNRPAHGPDADQARADAFRRANGMPSRTVHRPQPPAVASPEEDRIAAVRHEALRGR